MECNKTDFLIESFDVLISWAKKVRKRLDINKRYGLLRKEEEDKKAEINISNN